MLFKLKLKIKSGIWKIKKNRSALIDSMNANLKIFISKLLITEEIIDYQIKILQPI